MLCPISVLNANHGTQNRVERTNDLILLLSDSENTHFSTTASERSNLTTF